MFCEDVSDSVITVLQILSTKRTSMFTGVVIFILFIVNQMINPVENQIISHIFFLPPTKNMLKSKKKL